MKNSVRALSVLLLAALVSSILGSCSSKKAETAETVFGNSRRGNNSTSEARSKRAAISDDLPEADFDGYEFRILTRSNSGCITAQHLEDIYAESLNGDVIKRRGFTIETRKLRNVLILKLKPVVIDAMDESRPTATFKKKRIVGRRRL